MDYWYDTTVGKNYMLWLSKEWSYCHFNYASFRYRGLSVHLRISSFFSMRLILLFVKCSLYHVKSVDNALNETISLSVGFLAFAKIKLRNLFKLKFVIEFVLSKNWWFLEAKSLLDESFDPLTPNKLQFSKRSMKEYKIWLFLPFFRAAI